jgi:hypothetical protein
VTDPPAQSPSRDWQSLATILDAPFPAWPSWVRAIDTTDFHPSARRLLVHWQQIHPPHGLPGRQHFDPATVPDLLPNIRLVEVHRDPLRFRYRLLGSRVDIVHGRNMTNQWLDEAHGGDRKGQALLDDYCRVVETGQPTWRRGTPHVVPEPECVTVEVLRLPLARDGSTIDMLLCLNLYFSADGREVNTTFHRAFGY